MQNKKSTMLYQNLLLSYFPLFLMKFLNHVTENYFHDSMHDVLEGVAKFGMIAIVDFYNKTKPSH